MDRKLSAREMEVLRGYELGRRLKETRDSLGWRDIVDTMNLMVDTVKNQCFNAEYADPVISQAYQRRARAFQEFRDTLLGTVNKSIEISLQVPQLLDTDPADLDSDLVEEETI